MTTAPFLSLCCLSSLAALFLANVSTATTRVPSRAKLISKSNSTGKPLIKPRAIKAPTSKAPKPEAAAIVVMDALTGRLLYSHRAHTRRQVASTQKLVTALCVLEAGDLHDSVTVQSRDLKAPPYRMGFKVGETYTRGELLRTLLIASFNDVALALARDTAGSVDKFVARMNARAKKMGMKNTKFANPHGLPAKQYSTAYDMALAARQAYNSPFIRRVTDSVEYLFTLDSGIKKPLKNTNELLSKYYWVNGMKTGYTHAAGRCLISSASLNGESVIVVVLGSTHAKIWGESLKYLKWALKVK